jgi:hypothetical protein
VVDELETNGGQRPDQFPKGRFCHGKRRGSVEMNVALGAVWVVVHAVEYGLRLGTAFVNRLIGR